MSVNTEHLSRCILTLESSLELYLAAEPETTEREVYRNEIVKSYELCQEKSFKLMKRALKDFGYGGRRLEATPVKDLLRLCAGHGLMDLEEVDRWFAYRDNRNDTAHDYGEAFARETLKLLPGFLADVKNLKTTLRTRFGEDPDV